MFCFVDSLNFESGERKAITEEDVQHWKRRRIRSAKSAESLLSLPVTSRLGSPLTESLDPNKLMNMLSGMVFLISEKRENIRIHYECTVKAVLSSH